MGVLPYSPNSELPCLPSIRPADLSATPVFMDASVNCGTCPVFLLQLGSFHAESHILYTIPASRDNGGISSSTVSKVISRQNATNFQRLLSEQLTTNPPVTIGGEGQISSACSSRARRGQEDFWICRLRHPARYKARLSRFRSLGREV